MFPLILAAIEAIEDPKDRDFVERLFLEYANYVYVISRNILDDHHDAENAVSDVFLKVIKNRDRFADIGRERTVSLIGIYTRHTCYNIRKRQAIEKKIFVQDSYTQGGTSEDGLADSGSLETDCVGKEVVSEIKNLIKELPYPDGDMLWLKVFHNYSSADIAKIYGMNPSTVRNVLQRAKDTIAENVERRGLI